MATNKQKALAKKIAENPSLTMKEAMLSVGYSENTAVAPRNVTKSKGWQELIEEYLPDESLLKAPQDALNAMKWNDFTGEREPDHAIRLRAAEQGARWKGKSESGVKVQINNFIPILGDTALNVPKDDSDK